ncbi:LysM peptidoglycan-binding domain-containing protein [Spirosoma linguale]|uniref:Peptidoglycan-binding lysin domain protein n=1 Tax=Spirosoma linguale (strain ATCC 33905 / DSM 74 / LMG 10896 / Claus 1) TaxID=504472 RepID=D2QLA7_SPILD|nr:Peptidoglycan-binding lysin domain protein [Spirosoma linguale DSM 74]
MKKFPLYIHLSLLAGMAFTQVLAARPPLPTSKTVADSIGVEKKDGKRFILHRVDEGQTLFGIARRYKCSVADIRSTNPELKDGVKYGQVVRIQIPDGALTRKEKKVIDKAIKKQEKEEKKDAKVAATPKPKEIKPAKQAEKTVIRNDDPAKAGIHVVETGQTLYSLAGCYGVSQADIRKWNNLPGNNVLIGQALIVSEKAYQARMPATPTPATTSKPVDPPRRTEPVALTHTAGRPAESHKSESRPAAPPADTKPEHHAETPSAPAATKPVDSKPADSEAKATAKPADKPVDEVELPRPGNDAPMPTRGRRISSSGVAEMIEGNDGSGKYLALHRTAPIGTLVQVRNEFNNQSIWVKVIGRLPDTGVNDKILIKLSAQAFAKLSPVDRRFRAEVSYIVR